jgi:hypothetical protein
MRWARWAIAIGLVLAGGHIFAQSPYRIEIDLTEQRAYLLQGRRMVLASPISSGRAGHFTETGSFKIIGKERSHFSSMYGKIVDASGRTVVVDADTDMKVPRGGKFIPAPMHYFMRFHGATGMHAGYLPGYPASHGCVRMPEQYAIAFFRAVEVGTPVRVMGRTPRTRDYFRYGPQPSRWPPIFGPRRDPSFEEPEDLLDEPVYEARPYDPRMDPRYDPRLIDPWWR